MLGGYMAGCSCRRTLILLFASILVLPAVAQSHFPLPPESADKSPTTSSKEAAPRFKIDPLQLEREARELQELSQSIPADISRANQGLMPKDTIEKLKQIEKLAKHLRSELNP
jgi:hypothetical protein